METAEIELNLFRLTEMREGICKILGVTYKHVRDYRFQMFQSPKLIFTIFYMYYWTTLNVKNSNRMILNGGFTYVVKSMSMGPNPM